MADVFVFGSNTIGYHVGGSAKFAFEAHGAHIGVGAGRCGASYAIPTIDHDGELLPLPTIRGFVRCFLDYAAETPANTYTVVEIGCGVAGFSPAEIAPMFAGCSDNVILSDRFRAILDAPAAPVPAAKPTRRKGPTPTGPR